MGWWHNRGAVLDFFSKGDTVRNFFVISLLGAFVPLFLWAQSRHEPSRPYYRLELTLDFSEDPNNQDIIENSLFYYHPERKVQGTAISAILMAYKLLQDPWPHDIEVRRCERDRFNSIEGCLQTIRGGKIIGVEISYGGPKSGGFVPYCTVGQVKSTAPNCNSWSNLLGRWIQ